MPARYEISRCDWQVLRSLARCVRFLSVDQIARLTQRSRATARHRMRQLEKRGWVNEYRLIAQLPPDVSIPLATWTPGESPPYPSTISRFASRRYRGRELVEMTAYRASRTTFEHFGLARPVPPKRFQQTHDLGLSETFIHFSLRWPRVTRQCWIGEDVFCGEFRRFDKVEDAHLRRPGCEDPFLAVEFVGKYKPERLAALADALMRRELPFRWY